MPIQLENKFLIFKEDFKKDTGFEFNKENMALYIQYANFRANQTSAQVLGGLTHELLNKLNFLPGEISLKMAEMMKEHSTLKDLVLELKRRP